MVVTGGNFMSGLLQSETQERGVSMVNHSEAGVPQEKKGLRGRMIVSQGEAMQSLCCEEDLQEGDTFHGQDMSIIHVIWHVLSIVFDIYTYVYYFHRQ